MKTVVDYKYAKSHEWVDFGDDGVATIGITDYAQQEMGDLVFVNLPQEGDSVEAGEIFGDVESVKAVSEVYCPISGTVVAVNEELMDNPALINEQPYDAWFIKVGEITDKEELLSAEQYEQMIEAEK